MTKYILTILDTVSIQGYIFGSNRLRENIGASELVKWATEQWVVKALPQPHNFRPNFEIAPDQLIEKGPLKAEVMYAGGGNTVILFENIQLAHDFVTALSKQLLTHAPNLNLAVIHQEFDWETEALGGKTGVVATAMKQLNQNKRAQPASSPLAGLGVTAACQSTGQVAIPQETAWNLPGKQPDLISAEVVAKLIASQEAMKELQGKSKDLWYKIPFDFDDLGRSKGDKSYLAVVHIDGNGMGKKVEAIAGKFPQPEQNRVYIEEIRAFSKKLKKATDDAVKQMQDYLIKAVRFDEKGKETIMGIVPIVDKYLPYRPLVVGGDDFTFVCDGRLALTLSEFYLKTFEEITANIEGLGKIHACAGIAVVKSHYPFARAYGLAEALCKSAKVWVKESPQDFSALDWHFAPSGLMGELSFIREREYETQTGNLLMRPIALAEAHHAWRNWATFEKLVHEFNQNWRDKRNKLKTLRSALRKGPAAVKQFLTAYKLDKLPEITAIPEFATSGWHSSDKQCGYFDAVEAMEFFVPLSEEIARG